MDLEEASKLSCFCDLCHDIVPCQSAYLKCLSGFGLWSLLQFWERQG